MKIKNEVLEVLKKVRVEGNLLYIDEQLDRKTYSAVNKILKDIGGKWSSAKGATVFNDNVEEIICDIINTGEFISEKKQYQFFPTPEKLVKEILKEVEIKPEWNCLEPSAGTGNIAKFLPNCDCIELNPNNRKHLHDNGFNLIHDDFMTFVPAKKYNAIVMNPPFEKHQDIRHVTKAIGLATDLVVAIISASPLWRTDKESEDFRNLVASFGGTMTELPKNSFVESGTAVNTALVIVSKN